MGRCGGRFEAGVEDPGFVGTEGNRLFEFFSSLGGGEGNGTDLVGVVEATEELHFGGGQIVNQYVSEDGAALSLKFEDLRDGFIYVGAGVSVLAVEGG